MEIKNFGKNVPKFSIFPNEKEKIRIKLLNQETNRMNILVNHGIKIQASSKNNKAKEDSENSNNSTFSENSDSKS